MNFVENLLELGQPVPKEIISSCKKQSGVIADECSKKLLLSISPTP